MNIQILEDEEPAARQLRQQLAELGYAPSPPPVLRSIEKALVWLQTHPLPDLILSDIELLDGTVFALYEQFPVACPIIFTTAYDQYLLAAFRGNGIAYLLKPFTTEGLGAALGKYEQLRTRFAASAQNGPSLSPDVLRALTQALHQTAPAPYKQRFTVRMRNGLHLLQTADIAYLQADEGVTFAIDAAGLRYPLTGTLAELERQLDPARFGHLNRSELVNIAFIERIEPYFNNRLVVKLRTHNVTLTTSAAQTPEFRRWLEG